MIPRQSYCDYDCTYRFMGALVCFKGLIMYDLQSYLDDVENVSSHEQKILLIWLFTKACAYGCLRKLSRRSKDNLSLNFC